jgi:TolB-like protein/cytochrome c-type biogenesis protein CcmH/NrfG
VVTPRIPDFELLRLVGQGSYGDVWLARGVTGLLRAVKVVWRNRFADAAPFEREFRGLTEFAALSLGDSIQLSLLHVGRNDEAGCFYYVMELADDAEHGRTIDPARYVPLTLAELRRRRGRLPAAETIGIGIELARGLGSLHRRGLVHRDIKPSNVIIVGGRPKLADIGLVAPSASARTFIGTEGYVPPEGPGTPAADVFGLGKVLYELGTGRDQREFPQLPAGLAAFPDHHALLQLNQVILRACDPSPRRRYADAAALLSALLALRSADGPRSSRRWWAAVGLAALAAVVVAASRWWRDAPPRSPSGATPVANAAPVRAGKGIAVLPFATISSDPADAVLAEGMLEDLIVRLSLVRELRVVSRTSSVAYRDSRKTAGAIARELGVDYLVEASLRRVGSRLQVVCRLLDVASDRPRWTETYDRTPEEVLPLQTQLARGLVDALSSPVAPALVDVFAGPPTSNLQAYEWYTTARSHMDNTGRLDEAERLLDRAVELDPKFVAAWCALVRLHSEMIFMGLDTTPARNEKAARCITRARELAPEAPETIRAVGIYRHYVQRDYARARQEFERLRALQPNDASVYYWLGSIDMRQRRWAASIENWRRAVELDPANLLHSRAYRVSLGAARRWTEHIAEQRRIVAIWPGALNLAPRLSGPMADAVSIALTESVAAGALGPLRRLVESCAPETRETVALRFARLVLTYESGDFEEFKRLDRGLPDPAEEHPNSLIDSCLGPACMYFAHGDRAGGLARLGGVPQQLREDAKRDPSNFRYPAALAPFEAVIGNAAAAREAAQAAVRLCPESLDPGIGPAISLNVAIAYAWLGETDFAIAELERLVNAPTIGLTGFDLRYLPEFAPLRGHPRFEALARDARNNQPLL